MKQRLSRGRCKVCGREVRAHSPSPSASVDLPISAAVEELKAVPSWPHSLEPEAEADRRIYEDPPCNVSSWGRRDAIRSSIYAGFRPRRIATNQAFEERHHSPGRASSMGTRPAPSSGSFSSSSRPPAYTRQTRFPSNRSFPYASACRANQGRLVPATATQHRYHHA